MWDVRFVVAILLLVFFNPPLSSQTTQTQTSPPPPSSSSGVIHIPILTKGLNNQRMRIIQDITLATLLGASVELPTHVYSRKNCHYSTKCAKKYERGPSLWDVYDKRRTLEMLKNIGVSVVEREVEELEREDDELEREDDELEREGAELERERDELELQGLDSISRPRSFWRSWPIPATRSNELNQNYSQDCLGKNSGVFCSFGMLRLDCCLKLIPNTKESLKLLKSVNYAFQSALKFKIEASKIISSFKEVTGQNVVIAMHWRLDTDFVKSIHNLSSTKYCEGMLNVIKFVANKAVSETIVHLLVLGDADVEKVATILGSCGGEEILYKLHSKETLLSKNESLILTEEFTDVKGQLDFELGLMSDIFVGSPFSSFSVLIAFQRFGSFNHNSLQTMMANVDVKDLLGKIFSILFPYSRELEDNKAKCAALVLAFGPVYERLQSCVQEEIRLGFSPYPMSFFLSLQAEREKELKREKEEREEKQIQRRIALQKRALRNMEKKKNKTKII